MFKTRDGVVKERGLRWLSEEEAEGSRGNIREKAERSMGRKRKGSRPDGPFRPRRLLAQPRGQSGHSGPPLIGPRRLRLPSQNGRGPVRGLFISLWGG